MEGTSLAVGDHGFLQEKAVASLASRRDAALRVGRESFGEPVWADPAAPSGAEWVGGRGEGFPGQSGRETNPSVGLQGEFRWDIVSGKVNFTWTKTTDKNKK